MCVFFRRCGCFWGVLWWFGVVLGVLVWFGVFWGDSMDRMFLVRHPMVFIFLNLFVLLECPVMLVTLILVIKLLQQNFSNKGKDIINFVGRFQNAIGDILTKCLI